MKAILAVIVCISLPLLIYLFVRARQKRIRRKALLAYERISHEFRIPLTLIISQAELLLQNNHLPKAVQQGINKIYRNSFQLKDLANELLDSQETGQKQTRLNVCRKEIVSFVKEIFLSFEEQAGLKQIKYTFTSTPDTISCWFDPYQLQKVFYNVLTNAFRFADKKGGIEVLMNEESREVVIKIVDNGTNIDKKDLSKVFEGYYQASASVLPCRDSFSTSSGLALSKDIIELHHGVMEVESKVGYGSMFIIRLKAGMSHFRDDPAVNIIEDNDSYTIRNILLDNPEKDNNTECMDKGKHTILIVEGHEELLNTLSSIFSPLYNVVLAKDGKEGLETALDTEVDIILSNAIIPDMSGTEMTTLLKNNIQTCHIPIVLLTALSSTEKNIEGLRSGADDYIIEPFNSKVLLAKCNSLIRNRALQHQKYEGKPASNMELLANNELDMKFFKKVEEAIERNISNTEFTIDTLAQEIMMSRASLYNKFKQLTGVTPNDFVLNYKLKRAAVLLDAKPGLHVNEIADELGFGSARYFSRCFKEQFKMSPLEYKKRSVK